MKIYRIAQNVNFQDGTLNTLLINTDQNSVKQRNLKAQEFITRVIQASESFRQVEAALKVVEETIGISIANTVRQATYTALANSDTFKFLRASNLSPAETTDAIKLFSDQGMQSQAKMKIDNAVGAPQMGTGNTGTAGTQTTQTT